jgi:hypothetical protein
MRSGRVRRGVRRVGVKLRVEALEDRLVPTNWFVSTLGNDGNAGSQASPFRTIQHAVNVAGQFDRIHVAQGTYGYDSSQDQSSSILGVNKAVVIVMDKQLQIFGGFNNAFTVWDPAGAPTVIDGGGGNRGVLAWARGTSLPDTGLDLEGFVIQNGRASAEAGLGGVDATSALGGGMWINTGPRLQNSLPFVLRNVTFKNNRALGPVNAGSAGEGGTAAGGGLFLRFVHNVTLDHVAFDSNLAQAGTGVNRGGDAKGGGFFADHSNVVGTAVSLTNNRAVAGGTSGTGLDAANSAADGLGAAAAVQFGGTVSLSQVNALNNIAVGGNAPNGVAGGAFGGAFFLEANDSDPAALNLTDANLRGNIARGGDGTNGGIAGGGGIESANGSVSLDRVQVVANSSIGGAGSSKAGSPGGGGLYFTRFINSGSTPVNINNTLVADNAVAFAGGGDKSVGGGGGGIWLQGVAATITQSTIAGNTLDSSLTYGEGILLLNNGAQFMPPTTATIAFSIIANHTNTNPVTKQAALNVRANTGAGRNVATLFRVLYANNTLNDNSGGQPDPAGTFNFQTAPLVAASAGFVAPGSPNFNYHLTANSPARDQALGSGSLVDLDGSGRVGVPDLGAFELLPPPVPARDSVGTFDPSTGNWYLRNSNSPGGPDIPVFAFGAAGWLPVVGDWDGNGTATVGVFDPNTATFYLKNTNTPGAPDIIVRFGGAGWLPVVGDWDGNGTTTIGVFDPSTGTFYLKNSDTPGAPDLAFAFGGPGWRPLAGDWDGNRTDTVGVVDPNNNFYLKNVNRPGAPDIGPFAFGGPGWKPVAGDWNNDRVTTIGVVDPGGRWYLRNFNNPGAPDAGTFAFGAGNWLPVAGDYDAFSAEYAAGGPLAGTAAAELTQGQLDAFAAAALQSLAQRGADPATLARLASARLQVGRLGGGLLGEASAAADQVWIDADAAGYGWFVDPTPSADEEFALDPATGALAALPGGPAAGHMDLLTVLEHEWGHILGLADLDAGANPNDLMAGTLPAGVRR